jgi:hypothetical protein
MKYKKYQELLYTLIAAPVFTNSWEIQGLQFWHFALIVVPSCSCL